MRTIPSACLLIAALALAIGCGQRHNVPTGDCSQLDRNQCMASPSCSLVLEKPRASYTCRAAKPPCETAVLQSQLTNAFGSGMSVESAKANQKRCAGLEGCVYDGGNCYCHCRGYGETAIPDKSGPGCACVCSGGPPPICRVGP